MLILSELYGHLETWLNVFFSSLQTNGVQSFGVRIRAMIGTMFLLLHNIWILTCALAFLPTRFHGESTVMTARKKKWSWLYRNCRPLIKEWFWWNIQQSILSAQWKDEKKLVVLILLSLIANSETCVTTVLSPNWFTSSNLFQSSKALLLGFSLWIYHAKPH